MFIHLQAFGIIVKWLGGGGGGGGGGDILVTPFVHHRSMSPRKFVTLFVSLNGVGFHQELMPPSWRS